MNKTAKATPSTMSKDEYAITWPGAGTYVYPKVALYGSLLALVGVAYFLGSRSAKAKK
jgi:hypothetical protein